MPNRLRAFCLAAVCTSLLAAGTAHAQEGLVPPNSLVGRLLDLERTVNSVTQAIFRIPDPEQISVLTLARIISLEISTTPFGTSSGGFTFTFDSASGTFSRSSESFGPSFGKRSLTSGRGRLSAGFNWLYADYASLQGLNLSNGDYRPVIIRDLGIFTTIQADLSSQTVVGFVSYGVTNDLEVGIAVPYVRISLAADVSLFSTVDGQAVDVTPGGNVFVVRQTSAAGIGDIALLGKYRIWRMRGGGLATEVEVRLPSGDTNSLRGSGVTRTNISAIFSRGGRISPHANVGYEFWSRKVPLGQRTDGFAKDQITYALGLEYQVHSRATAVVDVVGRRQLHGGKTGYRTVPLGPPFGPSTAEVLAVLPRALDVVYVAPGIKWNVAPNLLLNCNLLTALSNRGLRANVIPVIGLDWAF